MKKIFSLLLISSLIVVGCTGQKVMNVEGKSENWASNITYEIGEHEQIGKGSIEYLGSDQLDNLSYEINYPSTFGIGGDGNVSNINESGSNDFPITINLPSHNIDMVSDEIENISITVVWGSITGDEFVETIEFSTK